MTLVKLTGINFLCLSLISQTWHCLNCAQNYFTIRKNRGNIWLGRDELVGIFVTERIQLNLSMKIIENFFQEIFSSFCGWLQPLGQAKNVNLYLKPPKLAITDWRDQNFMTGTRTGTMAGNRNMTGPVPRQGPQIWQDRVRDQRPGPSLVRDRDHNKKRDKDF